MNKQIISFTVNEQELARNGGECHYSSNKVSYIEAVFDLGTNWDSFDSVRAIWFTDFVSGIATVLDADGTCIVPSEVLKRKCKVNVNLVGSIVENDVLTDRLTSYPVTAFVVDANAKVDGTETAEITPSQFEQFVDIVQDAVANIKDIVSTTLNADYTLTFVYSDGTSYTTPSIRGERGPQGADGADGTDGNGIASAVLNSNYTLTLTFTDGTSYTTPSIRGAQGPKGDPGDVSQAQLDAAVSDLKSDLTQETNARTVADNALSARITDNDTDISVLQTSVTNLGIHKVAQPLDGNNQPTNGTSGQSLRTKGDGTTEWADVGLPTDEQTEEAVSKWLDAHPEATTTVQDGSLTEAKFANALKLKTIKDYVTPQMFGAVADANYYNAGAWYKDAGHTQPATDNITAFQNAIDSGFPVLVPKGSYYISDAIEIAYNGATLCGCGSEEGGSVLRCCGTNGIHVSSGFRLITIKNLSLTNGEYSSAAIEVSKGEASTSGTVHYLTIQNVLMVDFKYGLCIGGDSTSNSHDSFTYLWNCSFKDLKISTFNTGGDNYSIRIFQNGHTQFGLLFERVTCIGYTTDLYVEAISANFVSCNFGINAVKSIRCEYVSNVHFEDCNFECDSKVTSASAQSLILSTFKTVFMCCGFNAWTGNNVSFIDGSSSAEFTFIGNRSKNKPGDEMTGFFNISLQSRAGSIIFAGGNNEVPRPTPYKSRKLQLYDLERSILPIKDGSEIAITAPDYLGGVRFDATERIGGRPIWYDGISWRGAAGGEWVYLEDVAAGSSKTYTILQYDDRPRTALVTVRGHQNDAYAFGLLCKYRGNSLATFVPMYNSKCSISVSGDTITITNNHSSTLYMYISVLDLI